MLRSNFLLGTLANIMTSPALGSDSAIAQLRTIESRSGGRLGV